MIAKKLLCVALALCIAVSVAGLSFFVTLLEPTTALFSNCFAHESIAGLPKEEVVAFAKDVRAYSLGDDNRLQYVDNDRKGATQEQIEHLRDVREVFFSVIAITVLSTIAAAVGSIWLYAHKKRTSLGRALIGGSIAVLAVALVIVAIALIDFNIVFNAMHGLLFSGSVWTFDYYSLLITALPIEFWIAMGALWAVTLLVLCVALLLVGRKLSIHSR